MQNEVVPVREIAISEEQKYKDTIVVLMAMLDGISRYTFNGDVLTLGYYDAVDACKDMDIDEEFAKDVFDKFTRLWRSRRKGTQIETMFPDVDDLGIKSCK